MSELKVKKIYVIYVCIYMLLICAFTLMPHTVMLNKILGIATILCSIGWMFKCWNNMYLLIISTFVTYSNYSIVMGIYLDESLRPIYLYPQINDIETYSIGVFLLFLAAFSLLLLCPRCEKNSLKIAKVFIVENNENTLIFFLLVAVFLLICIFGYSRTSNARGSSTALYEYASILVILMFYFSGNRKVKKCICCICCLIYVLTSLINGTRIEALICILIFVLCFFENEISPIKLFLIMCFGLMCFSVIGTIRGNWSLLQNNTSEIVSKLVKRKFVFDTCTHAYFPMLCMINLYKEYSFFNALHFLGAFIMTIFLGQSRVADGDLIRVVGNTFYHNEGGVSLGFFFVWFSYMGALVYSLLVQAHTKLIYDRRMKITPVKCSAIIYVVASVPRWYLYGPWPLLRGVLICVIVTKAFIYFKNLIHA